MVFLPAGDVLLELRGVYKSFGAKDILAGASMQIRRGEAVGIIGAPPACSSMPACHDGLAILDRSLKSMAASCCRPKVLRNIGLLSGEGGALIR